jgi:hypothetical protein
MLARRKGKMDSGDRNNSSIESDQDGNLLRHRGGPGEGYDWPMSEHGIFVDHDRNVWLAANHPSDHQLLNFTTRGKFLQQIGKAGSRHGGI